MADNIYQPDTSAPAPVAAPVAASIPGGASDSPFSFGGDPNAPGMLGMSRGFWRDIANLGANMTTAANARTSGGFLANGTGFLGPFGAAVGETMQQGQKNAVAQATLNASNTQTIGEQLKNQITASGLPLTQYLNQQALDFAQHPEHLAAWTQQQQKAFQIPSASSGGSGGGATTPSSVATGGGTPVASNPAVEQMITASAQKYGIPEPLARALFQQESSLGTNKQAAGNIGQVTDSTATNPGYGMQGLTTAYQLKDPQTNVDYSLQYLRKVGEANGVTDWNDPTQWGRALRGYNGTGDPNYVTNVARFLPKGVQVADPGMPQVAGSRTPAVAANAPASAPAPANAPAASPAPASAAKTEAPFVVGDSIAQGVRSAGGYPGRTYSGASPTAVLQTIKQTPDAEIAGKNVVLSGGASNDPAQVALVGDQIKALQAKGAASVTLLGVGDSPKLQAVNAELATIAGATGARFTGPLDPSALASDRVHPANYKSLASTIAQANPTQGSGAGAATAGPGAPTTASGAATPVPATTAAAIPAPQAGSQPKSEGTAPTQEQFAAVQQARQEAAVHQARASQLTQQAAQIEMTQNYAAQMQKRGIMMPMPPGDPAALRTQANQENQASLDILKQATNSATELPFKITTTRNGDVMLGTTFVGRGAQAEEVYNPTSQQYEWALVGGLDRDGKAVPPVFTGVLAKPGPGDTEFQVTRSKGLGEQFTQVDEEAATAVASNYLFDNLRGHSKTWSMGKFADIEGDVRAWLSAAAHALGNDHPGLDTPLADYQTFNKSAGELLRTAVKQTSSRAALQEYTLIAHTLPQATSSEKAFHQVADQWQGMNDYKLAKQKFAQGYENHPKDFNVDFNANVSPTSFMLNRMLQAPEGKVDMKRMFDEMIKTPEGRLIGARMQQQYIYARDHHLFDNLPTNSTAAAPQQ